MNIQSFLGVWRINFATGPLSEPGKSLQDLAAIEIGTGNNGASLPFLCDSDYEIKVGFALLDSAGGVIFSSDSGALLTLTGEQLRWHGPYRDSSGLPKELNINIAVAEIFRDDAVDQGFYPYLFGCTVYGDPDQVGVWGGSGSAGGGNFAKGAAKTAC
ncbi:MAG: hypothetical protein WAM82_18385 [Thermoanaerobaculia bacterium]